MNCMSQIQILFTAVPGLAALLIVSAFSVGPNTVAGQASARPAIQAYMAMHASSRAAYRCAGSVAASAAIRSMTATSFSLQNKAQSDTDFLDKSDSTVSPAQTRAP